MISFGVDPYAAETVAVYRLYDARGQLLYVGQSANPKRRFYKHSKVFAWWPRCGVLEGRLVADQGCRPR